MIVKLKNLEEWLKVKTIRHHTEEELPEIIWFNSDVKRNQQPTYEIQTKKKDEKFLNWATKKYPEWVKKHRVGYLKNKLEELDEEIGFYANRVVKLQCSGWLKETLSTFIFENNLVELFSKKRRVKNELYCLEYPREVSNGTITDADIQAAKEVPITNFLSGEPTMRSSGKEIYRVPWRSDVTPSLHIYLKTNSYYDWARNNGGDVIDLIQRMYDMDFISAIKFILKK